ncbi:MAG: aminotransferase class V-fold PLP-dependent enzyme [Candidatus Cloacimonetes bacterium]|nr:aminotransferase class V-fold PLP-dependent enzyme [Candidatus Cloacimonadota bacterium]
MVTKDDFLLNKDIFFFNNGSYGACPKVVFDKYQEWQRITEFQPVKFFQKDLIPALQYSRKLIGEFINADYDDLILIRNATFATNIIIHSLDLTPDDEVILTNHEYGACRNAWEFWQQEKGFTIRDIEFDLPIPSPESIINEFEKIVTKNTKVIFFSQISSLTAQLFPAKQICGFAREHGIISIVDGAHSVGQFPLNIQELDPDFLFSNIHKWLYAPKGTAFLYTRKNLQYKVKPLITGWGWGSKRELPSGSDYVDTNQFYGTNDFSSFLTIPDAIAFYRDNNVLELKRECNALLQYFIEESTKITGKQSLYSKLPDCLMMAVIEIPDKYETLELKVILLNQYKIEIPVLEWGNRKLIRISIQIFNKKSEVDYFLSMLKQLF